MKLIRLTGNNGNQLMICVNHITCVESLAIGTLVHLVSGQYFSVKESSDEVLLATGHNNGN